MYYHPHLLVPGACEDRRWDYGGIICDCTVKVKKLLLSGMSPADNVEIKILRLDDGVTRENATKA
jgi:hypothetical protein